MSNMGFCSMNKIECKFCSCSGRICGWHRNICIAWHMCYFSIRSAMKCFQCLHYLKGTHLKDRTIKNFLKLFCDCHIMQMSFSLTSFYIPKLNLLMENKKQNVLFVEIERSVHEGQSVFCLAVLLLPFCFCF